MGGRARGGESEHRRRGVEGQRRGTPRCTEEALLVGPPLVHQVSLQGTLSCLQLPDRGWQRVGQAWEGTLVGWRPEVLQVSHYPRAPGEGRPKCCVVATEAGGGPRLGRGGRRVGWEQREERGGERRAAVEEGQGWGGSGQMSVKSVGVARIGEGPGAAERV